MTLPAPSDAAIEAAANALRVASLSRTDSRIYPTEAPAGVIVTVEADVDTAARVVLTAALPLLHAQWAAEVQAAHSAPRSEHARLITAKLRPICSAHAAYAADDAIGGLLQLGWRPPAEDPPAEERATALDHHDWARDARFAAKHPAPHEGDETVMIQFDNRSGHWIPDHPGTVDVSEHVDGPIEQVDRG